MENNKKEEKIDVSVVTQPAADDDDWLPEVLKMWKEHGNSFSGTNLDHKTLIGLLDMSFARHQADQIILKKLFKFVSKTAKEIDKLQNL